MAADLGSDWILLMEQCGSGSLGRNSPLEETCDRKEMKESEEGENPGIINCLYQKIAEIQ